ncbi:MAG: TetR/AcrR family transcriptional regulator [Thermaerobacterales bacterium]
MKTSPEALMGIAFRSFLRKGYHQTRMIDLVEASGLSKGALHHHFPRKSDLLQACISFLLGNFLPGLTPLPGHSLPEFTRIYVQRYANFLEDLTRQEIPHSSYFAFVLSLAPEHSRQLRERYESLATNLAGLYEQDVREGRMASGLDGNLLADQLIALIEGQAMLLALTSELKAQQTKTPLRPNFERLIDGFFAPLVKP